MLERHFVRPVTLDRIRACWIGSAIERYVAWLDEHAYSTRCVIRRVPLFMRFGEFARRQGANRIADLRRHVDAFVSLQLRRRLRPCRSPKAKRQFIRDISKPIQQFLGVVQAAPPRSGTASRPFAKWAPGFLDHLHGERGLSSTTIAGYFQHLTRFEEYLAACGIRSARALSPAVLDGFLAARRAKVSARSLSGVCAALRAFLRYLFRQRLIRRDLGAVVDGPRTYALSGIPRSISWEEVQHTLATVDRRSVVGKRDYAILLLLVVYGLRAREVASLTLDDIEWRGATLHIRGRKAGHATIYPLATEVGEAVLDYLRHGRPQVSERRLFLRGMAPRAAVTHRIVSNRAKYYLKKAGIEVHRPGSHTLRHSCAQRLVDADFSLKVIGDFLGHRHASSTRIYSKVSIGALREVALGDGEAIL
jgi:integrase/recombinase XerD